jgi:DNA adenine methylase
VQMNPLQEIKPAKPFLRWAGGKKWFVKQLNANLLPTRFNNYHEPFLGGGSMFFNIKCSNLSFLSDSNAELVNAYCSVRDNVEGVIGELKKMSNTKEEYYAIRSKKYSNETKRAAQFIFLNKTSFNGIYRVNRDGFYNVPYGYRLNTDYVEEDNLRRVKLKLTNSIISCLDFEEALRNVKRNDFIFIDPPYTVAHEKNGFIEYNQKIFTLDDQYRLANVLRRLNKIGAYYLVTNAYHVKIKEVYAGTGTFQCFERNSLIGGKNAKREAIKEYVIKNY